MNEEITVATVERPMTRLEAKEAIRLGYISGRGSLVELSARHGIPGDTAKRWSIEGKWTASQITLQRQTDAALIPRLADWISTERERQVKRGLGRSLRVQRELDAVLDRGTVMLTGTGEQITIPLNAKDLQSIAVAEDKLDGIARRNLGMSEEHGGQTVNVNVLSNVREA